MAGELTIFSALDCSPAHLMLSDHRASKNLLQSLRERPDPTAEQKHGFRVRGRAALPAVAGHFGTSKNFPTLTPGTVFLLRMGGADRSVEVVDSLPALQSSCFLKEVATAH